MENENVVVEPSVAAPLADPVNQLGDRYIVKESSTNDSPTVATIELPDSNQESTEPGKEEDPGSVSPPEAAPPKKVGGVAKRIDELTAAKYELKQLHDAVERDRDHWRELALKNTSETKTETVESKQPDEPFTKTVEDFDDYESYVVAKAEHRIEQKIKAREAANKAEAIKSEQLAKITSFKSKVASFAESNPDFNAVVNDKVPINESMRDVILASENGPAIAYYLGSNLDEASRIWDLSPSIAAYELGKIESKITAPKVKKPSNAPEPIKGIGSNEKVTVSIDNLDNETYRRLRKQGVL